MKCKNCGTNNDQRAIKCSSCNAPLDGSMIIDRSVEVMESVDHNCKNCGTRNSSSSIKCSNCNAPLAGTNIVSTEDYSEVKTEEHSISTSIISSDQKICDTCGYPNTSMGADCVHCNGSLKRDDLNGSKAEEPKNASQQIDPSMTINPWLIEEESETGFLLCSLDESEDNETSNLDFDEDHIELKRSNLDSKNKTITSDVQAVIEKDGDQWFLSNKSSLQTTFIRVDNKRALAEGDVILFGNKLFRFQIKR